jgi:RimJ/RimL family protein N-acetyltransferase
MGRWPLLLRNLPADLSDGVILLDAHRMEDAEAHLLGEDEEMRRRFDAVRPATLNETRQALERWIAARDCGGDPMFAYAMRELSGQLIGGCELRMRSANSANLSYWVFAPFRGRGYALRAVNLLASAAERIAGLNRLELRIAPDHESSRRVARKAGFTEEGTVEEKAWTGALSTMEFYTKDVSRG